MNHNELKATHMNVDDVIADIARRLADESTPGKPIETERDMAIIMACCSLTKSELPEDRDGTTRMDNDNMRRWMEQIAEEARNAGGSAYPEILGRLSEFAYEFDEDLSKYFDEQRESAERPPEEKPEPVTSASEIERIGAAVASGEEMPEPAAGAFSGTEESVKAGKMADGAPIPSAEHINTEGTEGYGYGVLPDDYKRAVRLHLQVPDGGEVPDIEGWRYSQPTSVLVFQVAGRPEPSRVNVDDALADLGREAEATGADDAR
jgi:hypothetical protein